MVIQDRDGFGEQVGLHMLGTLPVPKCSDLAASQCWPGSSHGFAAPARVVSSEILVFLQNNIFTLKVFYVLGQSSVAGFRAFLLFFLPPFTLPASLEAGLSFKTSCTIFQGEKIRNGKRGFLHSLSFILFPSFFFLLSVSFFLFPSFFFSFFLSFFFLFSLFLSFFFFFFLLVFFFVILSNTLKTPKHMDNVTQKSVQE